MHAYFTQQTLWRLTRNTYAFATIFRRVLVQSGGETMIDVLTEICNRIWKTGEWPTPWTQSLFISIPIKGNL